MATVQPELAVDFEVAFDPASVSEIESCNPDADTPYVLTAAVSRNLNIPSGVFVLVRESVVPEVDKFQQVAAVVDLDNLQAGSPASGQTRFLVTSVILRFPTLEATSQAKSTMETHLNQLVADWKLHLEGFVGSEVVQFPL